MAGPEPKGKLIQVEDGGEEHESATSLLAQVRPVFEALGLNGYQSLVLAALLQTGPEPATSAHLSELSGVPRTSVYPTIEELAARGLVAQAPGKALCWVSLGPQDALDALYSDHRTGCARLRHRVEQAREVLARLPAPSGAQPSLPFVRLIGSAWQAKWVFQEALAETSEELLVLVRPPSAWLEEEAADEAVLDTLGRVAKARMLYQRSDLAGAAARIGLEEYRAAGAEVRVADQLPVEMAVFDRRVALITLSDPANGDDYPTPLLLQNAGYTRVQALAFDRYFEGATPYEDLLAGPA